MSYATITDMESRFGTAELIQLSDRALAGVVDTAVVNTALDDAANLIDSHIAVLYALPLTSTPPILTMKACEIARYNLFGDAAPEQVKARYDAAVAWLKSLATGKAKLDVAGVETPSMPDIILTDGPERTFSRDSLRGL